MLLIDELAQLAQANPDRFSALFTVTRESPEELQLAKCPFCSRRVDARMLQEHVLAKLPGAALQVLVCGPSPFVTEGAVNPLQSLGVAAEQIYVL